MTNQTFYKPNELLSRLVGDDLYSVQFVMGDRVEFWFGGAKDDFPHLLCDVWPVVEVGGRSYRYADVGYGDALMRLIPATVIATHEETGIGIKLFLEGASITVHPDRDVDTVEIAMLIGFGDKQWMVWRPGEESFEDLG
jgi:hypothetical protein